MAKILIITFFLVTIVNCKAPPNISSASCQVGRFELAQTPGKFQNYVDIRPGNNVAQYLITVKMGDKKQSNTLVFDTGSSDLLVQGVPSICRGCPSPVSQYGAYEPTGKSLATRVNLAYGTTGAGMALADAYLDTIDLGCSGTPLPSFELPFLVITTNQLQLEEGILGLAYPSLSRLKRRLSDSQTFIQALLTNPSNGSLDFKNLFAVTLCGNKAGSRVIFGSYDNAIPETSSFQWVPIETQGYYSVSAEDFWVQDWKLSADIWTPSPGTRTSLGKFLTRSANGTQTIVDSGTTLTLLNETQTNNLRSLMLAVNSQKKLGIPSAVFDMNPTLPAPATFTARADTLSQFPLLGISITAEAVGSPSTDFQISPQTYFKNWDGGLIFGFGQGNRSLQILGQTFMEGYHIVFDITNNRLGFTTNEVICGK